MTNIAIETVEWTRNSDQIVYFGNWRKQNQKNPSGRQKQNDTPDFESVLS